MVSHAVSEFSVANVRTASVSSQTIANEEFAKCLPIESIHNDGLRSYVYVVTEVSSLTGSELGVQRLYVTILGQNQTYVALDDVSITRDQQVVIKSDRMISESSRIRIVR
jgi:hypothetical protein